ncbi:hypothetical protein CY35_18G007800 [Sphagnum magellanicum]|nr:hypothetical protein CY35_18G007800 [Sphagnum magellanicum]
MHQVLEGLQNSQGNKEIPFSLLYNKKGSELYEEKTKLEEYYPFLAEDHMLELLGDEIAAQIPLHSVIVELGCHTARKTAKILSAIQACHRRCQYAGIDVSGPFLEEAYKNLMQNVDGLQHEDMDMVQADYMEGLKIVWEYYPHENVCILWLGSSVGNLSASAAVQFLRDAVAAVGTHCQIFLCADMWKDPEHLRAAYYDKVGVTGLFIKNRMCNALALFGHEVSTKDEVLAGERVLVEVSRKFTVGDFNHLANESRNFPDWSMKPIDVRHPFCFYYGHLPAFAELKLFPNEVPTKFDVMFSQGIDPIVNEPSKCHGHPEVPVQWPTREEIIDYVQHVREDLMEAMDDARISARNARSCLRKNRQTIVSMHYLIICSIATTTTTTLMLESTGTTTKKKLSAAALKSSIYSSGNNMVPISNGNAMMGGNVADNGFMWDNEYPQFTTHVSEKFLVSSEPVSVRDFLTFVKEGGYKKEEFWQPVDFKFFKDQGHKHPATWSKVHGEYYVHSVDSTDHWSKVADQPVFVSLSEAEAFCHSVGCCIMTESEYHQILLSGYATKVHKLRSDGWEWTSSVFQSFPGFKPMVEYPEYSSDFFNSSHYVLKGASPLTHPKMWRDSFRNFYQQQYPFVFAKFRCCKNM